MASALFRNPYEMGKAEGKLEEKTDMVLTLLSKKFGILPIDAKEKISEANNTRLI